MTIRNCFLFLLLSMSGLGLAQAADYIEMYINPSSARLDWSSPRSIGQSYIKTSMQQMVADKLSSVSKSTVGHAVVHYHCTNSQGELNDFYAGMSGQETLDDSYKMLLQEKTGALVLFKNYQDGYIETDEESRNLIAHQYARKDKNADKTKSLKESKFIRFAVDAQACDRGLDVYESYKDISYEAAKDNVLELPDSQKVFYGLGIDAFKSYVEHKKDPNSPLGAICTSFVVAVFKAAGVYDPDLDHFWLRHLEISEDKIGGMNPATGKRYLFSVADFYSSRGNSWITPGVPTRTLDFYEPEKIWNFIESLQICQADQRSSRCSADVLAWMIRHQKAVHTVNSEVEGDFEQRDVYLNEHGQVISMPVREYSKKIKVNGISL